MIPDDSTISHPSEAELAAYLGGELSGPELERLEAHLAGCPTCRQEIIDSMEILRGRTPVRWRLVAPIAAAAAVAVLLFPVLVADDVPTGSVGHREAPAEVLTAPAPIFPVGDVAAAATFIWTRVAGADRYRVTLFSSAGTVLWQTTTTDSTISLPPSLTLAPGEAYLWQVEARVGWDVWEASGLTDFELNATVTPLPEPGS